MRIDEDIKLDFQDVLLVPQRSSLSSRSEVSLERTYKFAHSSREITGVGIIAANMDSVGTFAMAKALAKHKMFTALHKHYTEEQLIEFFCENKNLWNNVFYTVGANDGDFNKLISIKGKIADKDFPYLLCIDAANGYTQSFIDYVKKYRQHFTDTIIMAGNVATSNMAEELILSGADCSKVGIGGGSVCSTRIKTGVGVPQLSCIDDCAYVVHGKPHGHICSDGGITTAGDASKAFAVGADFIMCGGVFAGTDECEGTWTETAEVRTVNGLIPDYSGKFVKKGFKFYGMSSKDAQDKYNGGLAPYKASEGKTVEVPYKGPVDNVVQDLLGGIRSACTMIGAEKIKDMPKCASFIKVFRQHNSIYGNGI